MIFAALQILPACRNGSDQGETEGVWAKVEFRPLKIKKSTEPVDLNRSVYLNEVYRSFSRLETSRDLVYQKYRYGLSGIRILSGEAKRKRGILDIRGESIVFALEVDPELLKAASLELLEMEVRSPEDLTVKIFDATGTGDSIENPGNFIFEKFIPGQDRPGFQKAQIDLGQRFGWEKKEVRRLIVKINPPQAESIRVKVRNPSLTECGPACGDPDL